MHIRLHGTDRKNRPETAVHTTVSGLAEDFTESCGRFFPVVRKTAGVFPKRLAKDIFLAYFCGQNNIRPEAGTAVRPPARRTGGESTTSRQAETTGRT